jgi:hypothetical protein
MRWIAVLLLLLAVGALGVVGLAAPTISVDSPVYTASVQSGSMVTHTFRLTNAGDETLKIANVMTSCGCTTTTLAKTDLVPGESIGLEAKVNTTGFVGTVERTVTVQSNDPATPNLVLRLALTMVNEAPAQTSPSTPTHPPASSQTPAPTPSTSTGPTGASAAIWPLVLVGILAVGLLVLLVSALGG